MLGVVVHTDELLQTIAASVVVGVGITIVFSIAIWGAARFVDLSSNEQPVAAGVAAAVGIVALATTIAAVVVGILVMTSK